VGETAQPVVDRGDLKSTTYEFFMLAMAILSIANLPLLALFPFQSQYWYLVGMVEIALTLVFLDDFVYRLRTARSRWGYFYHQQGFLDLLSCVPALRIFRLFRILRAVRIVRRLGGPRVLRELRQELASGALYFIVVVGITTLEVVGLLELYFEEDAPGANITTAGAALWWGYVTATTVGYGDQYR
jgi:voltage-gated potassium channel